jgi:hypothetical protein
MHSTVWILLSVMIFLTSAIVGAVEALFVAMVPHL